MRRLTEKRDGVNVIPLRNAVRGIDLPYWRLTTPTVTEKFLSGVAADRLAAYEETGLEPDEITDLQQAWDMYGGECGINAVLNLIDQYNRAKSEGRLVMLPCKVGDTVYRFSRLEGRIQTLKCEGFLYNGFCWKARCTDVIPSWVGNQKRHFYIMFSSFGKTVFFTREEAEAAPRKEQDNG